MLFARIYVRVGILLNTCMAASFHKFYRSKAPLYSTRDEHANHYATDAVFTLLLSASKIMY